MNRHTATCTMRFFEEHAEDGAMVAPNAFLLDVTWLFVCQRAKALAFTNVIPAMQNCVCN